MTDPCEAGFRAWAVSCKAGFRAWLRRGLGRGLGRGQGREPVDPRVGARPRPDVDARKSFVSERDGTRCKLKKLPVGSLARRPRSARTYRPRPGFSSRNPKRRALSGKTARFRRWRSRVRPGLGRGRPRVRPGLGRGRPRVRPGLGRWQGRGQGREPGDPRVGARPRPDVDARKSFVSEPVGTSCELIATPKTG